MSDTALFDTVDLAMRLGIARSHVTELLKKNSARYGAFKQRGHGRFTFRERWRVPRGSLELLRADLLRAKA